MADSYAKLGTAGVVLVNNDYHPSDGAVENAQNAELVQDAENGGEPSLAKRGGVKTFGSAFASAVTEMVQIRFLASL
jgi:hypothetical protein